MMIYCVVLAYCFAGRLFEITNVHEILVIICDYLKVQFCTHYNQKTHVFLMSSVYDFQTLNTYEHLVHASNCETLRHNHHICCAHQTLDYQIIEVGVWKVIPSLSFGRCENFPLTLSNTIEGFFWYNLFVPRNSGLILYQQTSKLTVVARFIQITNLNSFVSTGLLFIKYPLPNTWNTMTLFEWIKTSRYFKIVNKTKVRSKI